MYAILGSGTFCLILVQFLQLSLARKYNVSSEELDNCLHYVADDGYTYKKFFKIRPDMHTPQRDPDDLVNLKLFVHAAKDVHILLSNSVNPPLTEPVYEIVLDAGDDTFSEIRNRRSKVPLKTVRRHNVIEPDEITPVVIRVTRGGTISVTLGNSNNVPTLTAFDPALSPVQYLSFAAWRKFTWVAYFDCHANKGEEGRNATNSGGSDDLDAVGERLTPKERLKLHLLNKYDADVTPEGVQTVPTKLRIEHVEYAADTATLSTRAVLSMEWTDPKLRWNPDEYDGVGGVILARTDEKLGSVWTPDVFLFNARGDQFSSLALDLFTTVTSKGNVTVYSRPMVLRTICTDFGAGSITGMWPFDALSCPVEIGVLEPHLRLVPSERNSIEITIDERTKDSNGWKLELVRLSNGTNVPVFGDDPAQAIGTCDLIYSVTLRRNSAFYMHVFGPPLVLVHVLLLMSFWCPRAAVVRVSLCGLAVAVAALVLLASGPYTPNGYVPTLMRYYEWTLYMAWLACVLFVIDRQLDGMLALRTAQKKAETGDGAESMTRLERMLRWPWVRMVFGLDDDNSYDRLGKADEEPARMDIRIVLDRCGFVTFALVFAIGYGIGV